MGGLLILLSLNFKETDRTGEDEVKVANQTGIGRL